MSLHTALAPFARIDLLEGPTPLHRAKRLEQVLGLSGINLYLKRDDHTPLGGGGNKLRKLEFLLGTALGNGVDTVVTIGGVQSNHARLTAAACARLGLACELVLGRAVDKAGTDYDLNGNVLLDQLFGARLQVLDKGMNTLAHAEARATELRAAGHTVLVLPTGGSTPLGSLGYARCAAEIIEQEQVLGLTFKHVFVPNGSAGTHAGLAAGFEVAGRGAATVKSWSVLADEATALERTLQLTHDALALLGSPAQLKATDILIDGRQLGEGYGQPTQAMQEAVRLLARTEGLLVDPVYSGKALAGLLADLKQGRYAAGDNLLFIMTGGTPGLYAYRETFQDA
ncbi:MAG: D-cysteine desulfhydrase [Pseudomonas sp.]|nr:MAG: D-cysteine desulfhydrase [Pseudomonas sp.]